MKPRPERPTLRTIAELTGLAVTTVSRALLDAPQIALETRQRVQRVAREVGYQPDRAARHLRTGRTNVISVVLDPHDELLGFSTSMIRGLTQALRDTPYHLVITPHFAETPSIEPIEYMLRNRMADGVVFSRTEPSDPRVRLLLENDFPFVSHGRTLLGQVHPFVDYDNAAFAMLAVRRLVAKGRRRLALILPPDRFTFHRHLRDGFLEAVRAAGVAWEFPVGVTLDSSSAELYAWLRRRLQEPSPPDGIVCAGEVSALSIMAVLSDQGLAVGEHLDLVVKQTSLLYDEVRPRIDAVYEDIAEAGELLGRLLVRRIAGEDPAGLQHLQKPIPRFADRSDGPRAAIKAG
ncbi:LacI family transcriptional regulator [Nitratireductor sp. ZSWI3]|uniref:LacI family transcriptional regulator n=1 Tax=Nitratireductor sp. ZSWI3 TaxID=2966359 RepID=UPI00214FD29C|nr:LacI family transcriptional regulator [Nitratireductor sp. ZSWI3]MCR4267673.1 LacI family transcriptional regulator [Nitratireductor sp. ZSWI3]